MLYRLRRRRRNTARLAAHLALKTQDLAPLPDDDAEARHDAGRGADSEKHQQHEYQRRLPFQAEKITHHDAVAVLERKAEQQQEHHGLEQQKQDTHHYVPSAMFAACTARAKKSGMIFR